MLRRFRFVAAVLIVLSVGAEPSAFARNEYLLAWEARYPTSTLPDRMAVQTGAPCFMCHHPSAFDNPGNCYREALRTLILGGSTIEEALDLIDGEDSDLDGIPNGVEITTPYADQPGQVGYNPGLVGPAGTDPCFTDPNEVVSGMLETPVIVEPIPTVSQWGLAIMALLVGTSATLVFARRTERPV